MGSQNGEVPLPKGGNELLQAQALLFNHIFKPVGAMSVKCAVELGIPDAVHRHGRPATLPELLSALSIPAAKASAFRRLMRILTHSGFFHRADQDQQGGGAYSLTPLSRLLVGDKGNHSPFALAVLHPIQLAPFQFMGAWFKDDGREPTPFSMAHGCGFWDMTERQPALGQLFNEGLASDAHLLMSVLVADHKHVFQGLRSLVDIGGGNGSAARALVEAFPQLKCSVLELPHVVEATLGTVEEKGSVEFIKGDMFQSIPPADAVFLKCIMHDWSDEDCVKILRRCKAAVPSREDGGKVIIVDITVADTGDPSRKANEEAQLYMDIWMMVKLTGAERDELEWRSIFLEAGFTDYKIMPILGLRSLIELYP